MLKGMDRSHFLTTGRRVVAQEAGGLSALAEALDDGFADTVALILSAPGRVILSGLGKSGHIARKIAATLASTGTPALYVHPVEASHGDLGMMAPGDVLVILSKSGETAELADLIAYSRRHGIALAAITSGGDSALARTADTMILLPDVPEACDRGLVPTTSTTLMLAAGDALAIALMEHRQFTPEHFRSFHPGGTLGARLITVRDLMHADPPRVSPGTPMPDAIVEMSGKGLGMITVVDAAGDLAGIITDGDLRRHVDGLMCATAGEVMTPTPQTIGPDALAETAVQRMNAAGITGLAVVDPAESRRLVGLLHLHDCLRAGIA